MRDGRFDFKVKLSQKKSDHSSVFFSVKKKTVPVTKMRKSAHEKKSGVKKYENPSIKAREKEITPVKISVKFHP